MYTFILYSMLVCIYMYMYLGLHLALKKLDLTHIFLMEIVKYHIIMNSMA